MLAYIRTPRAAVAVDASNTDDCQRDFSRQTPAARSPSQTLWASRPPQVRAGWLIAVRLRGEELQVAFVTTDGRRWARADAVLTAAQAERWVKTSEFSWRT